MSMHKNVITLCCAAAFALGLAACSSSDDPPPPPPPPPVDPGPSAYEAGKAAIMAAMTEADAQAAYDDIDLSMVSGDEAASLMMALNDRVAAIMAANAYANGKAAIMAATTAAGAQAAFDAIDLSQVSGAEAASLRAALASQLEMIATAGREDMQKMALMDAAGMIDTSDLTSQANIDAANAAIAGLQAALDAAADVSDADKAMYQTMVDSAEGAVMMAQSALDHAAQTDALTAAVAVLQAIDLSSLSTQQDIDDAEAAIAAVRAALEAATELSAVEKSAANVQLQVANLTVMRAQGRFDMESQRMALSDAIDALRELEGDDVEANLMTQAQIDAYELAIAQLMRAIDAATDLSETDKYDAIATLQNARHWLDVAQTALDENIGNQRMALSTAGMDLADIDLADLDTQDKIDAAEAAVEALEMALDDATHLSASEKAMYQEQLDAATETVRMAQTGMDRNERMTAQRSAIMNAVTMARTAVAGVNDDSTDTEVASAEAAIAALKMAIEDAEDLPEGDANVSMAMGTLATLEGQLAAAKTSRMAAIEEREDEQGMAMAALGKAMHDALGGAAANTNALANVAAAPQLSADGSELPVDAAENAGALTTNPASVTLEAVDGSDMSLGDWMSMDYAHSTGRGPTLVTNEARVYTNQGDPTPGEAFNVKYILIGTEGDANFGGMEVGVETASGTQSATPFTRVKADGFTHSGIRTHVKKPKEDAVYVDGYYDGVSGQYRCHR